MDGPTSRKRVASPTTPLRIAMVSLHSSPVGQLGSRDTGGMSVYIRNVARELSDLGHSVDIYTGRSNGGCEAAVALGENVRLIQLNSGKEKKNTSVLSLHRCLPGFYSELEGFQRRRSIEYDLIHSHYWLSGCLGVMVQEQWKIPHVITFHTLAAVKNSFEFGEPEPVIRLDSERMLAGACHLIISSTGREKEQLNRFYDAAPEKVVIIPCGVDLDVFRPISSMTARQKLGYPSTESILLYVGRFDPLKGIDRLLEASSIVMKQRKVRLIIVGGDGSGTPENRRLQGIVKTFGLQDHVIFVGRVDQHHLSLYYSAADVLVIPSHYESFGLVALESLACGTPVVSTPVGAVGRIIIEGRTGHVAENARAEALALSILKILFSSETGVPLSDPAAIRDSVRQYNWTNVAAKLSEEYINICFSGGR